MKYTISIDFDVETDNRVSAYRLAEEIENLIATQIENKELFVALEGSEVIDVWAWESKVQ